MRHPLGRITGVTLSQHLIDLLQGQALSLRNQEIGESYADDAEGTPHEENLGR